MSLCVGVVCKNWGLIEGCIFYLRHTTDLCAYFFSSTGKASLPWLCGWKHMEPSLTERGENPIHWPFSFSPLSMTRHFQFFLFHPPLLPLPARFTSFCSRIVPSINFGEWERERERVGWGGAQMLLNERTMKCWTWTENKNKIKVIDLLENKSCSCKRRKLTCTDDC